VYGVMSHDSARFTGGLDRWRRRVSSFPRVWKFKLETKKQKLEVGNQKLEMERRSEERFPSRRVRGIVQRSHIRSK